LLGRTFASIGEADKKNGGYVVFFLSVLVPQRTAVIPNGAKRNEESSEMSRNLLKKHPFFKFFSNKFNLFLKVLLEIQKLFVSLQPVLCAFLKNKHKNMGILREEMALFLKQKLKIKS
jgi:hypothetical protein